MMPRNITELYRRFERTGCLSLQDRIWRHWVLPEC